MEKKFYTVTGMVKEYTGQGSEEFVPMCFGVFVHKVAARNFLEEQDKETTYDLEVEEHILNENTQ